MLRILYLLFVYFGAAVYAAPFFYNYASFDDAVNRVFPNTMVSSKNIELSKEQHLNLEEKLFQKLPENRQFVLYTFSKKDNVMGYGLVLDQLGKHYPITFFVGINKDLTIKDVVVMIYREDYGQNVKKRRFLKQFYNKSLADPIQVNRDITSVSGATISSYSIATGVKRGLLMLKEVKNVL